MKKNEARVGVGTLHQFVRFFNHPIWCYSPSQILKAVQRDWEGPVFTGARTILGEMAKQNTRVMVYTFSEKNEPFLELECTARLPKPNPSVLPPAAPAGREQRVVRCRN